MKRGYRKRQHPTDQNLFWCPKCKMYKARSAFYKTKVSPSTIHGIAGWCRECTCVPVGERTCPVCHKKFMAKGKKRYCSRKCHDGGSHGNNAEYYRKHHPIKTIESQCPTCGKSFPQKTVSGNALQKYCSYECRYKFAYRAKYNRTCCVCGKQFISRSIVAKVCSRKCQVISANGELIKRTCPVCGKTRVVHSNEKQFGSIITNHMCPLCRAKENKKRHPEHPEKTAERNRRKVKLLTDGYVRATLGNLGVPKEVMTKEVLGFKRQQIVFGRELKQLKKEVSNGIA